MTEVAARQKYSCPSCGAEAVWNPAKQALVCAYCGTVSPAKLNDDGSVIREHDLAAALRDIPESERGLASDKQRITVKCQSCQAISSFDSTVVAQRCEFCGSSALVPYDEIKEVIRPESLLPFKLPETTIRETMRRWYQSRWFAPGSLGRRAMTDTVKGVYLPYWTFDARVHADWTAEAGHYYYETQSYTDGQGRTQTRQVQRIRWVPAAGAVDHFFDDQLICGSRGVPPDLVRAVEPFPTTELAPYDPGYVSGWIVERYSIDLRDASITSQHEMEAIIQGMCARQVPGDTYRNLQVYPQFAGRTFKHILTPIWLLTYTYGPRAYRVIVNGYTGQIAGTYPKSVWKILFAVLGALILIALGLWLFSQMQR